MKAKLKNANGFVRFLLNHGEKVGIAAILAVAGLLISSSLGREKLGEDKQHEPLRQLADSSRQKVQAMSWESIPEEERTSVDKFLTGPGERVITPVSPEAFPPIDPINPPKVEPLKKRTDPVLLAVSDVEVNAGSGLWMSADPTVIREKMIARAKQAAQEQREAREEAEREAAEAEEGGGRRGGRERGEGEGRGFGGGEGMDLGGSKTKDGAIVVQPAGGAEMQGFEDIQQRSWVTVLAKVPIKQQFQMYEDALAGAGGFNATNDAPEYLGYFVERAEVTAAGGPGKWTKLPTVNGSGIIKVMKRWPIRTPELVNPKYVHPLLTFPLPPMVMREWGDEITHSDMPIQTPEEMMEEQMREAEAAQQQPEEAEEDADNPFASVIERRTQPMLNNGMGAEGFRGEFGASRGGYPSGGMGREGMMSRGMGGEGGGMGRFAGGGVGGEGPEELPTYAWDGKTPFLLFRYFDSTVQPGHRYRYRVRLAMIDVNAQQIPRFLAPEASERIEKEKAAFAKANPGKPVRSAGYRLTDWSEPSSSTVVPQPGLMYIASVKVANQANVNAEPEARVVIKSLDADTAAEVALGGFFTRGAVLNASQRAQIIWSSLFKVDPEEPTDSPVFDFVTGLTILDFDGGEPLSSKSRNLLAPARALVMDSAGRMQLRSELDDQKVVRRYDAIMQASDEAARRARERGDERRPGREGGRR
jgi:hypothetical protein